MILNRCNNFTPFNVIKLGNREITLKVHKFILLFECFVILFCPLFFTSSLIFPYELPELDGDDIAGNAPAILGWHEKELPLKWAVVENNGPGSPVTTSAFVDAVSNSFDTWENIETSIVSFEKANNLGSINGVIPLTSPVTSNSFSPVRSLANGRMGPPFDDGYHNVCYCIHENWEEDFRFSRSALAVTLFAFSSDSGQIVGGDIFLNCDNIGGEWNIIDPVDIDPASYDLQNTITHEIGHLIGLAHPYDKGREDSTMYYSASYGETKKRNLSQDDINGANYLYPEPGVTLIPPDNNKDGLKTLANPSSGKRGGCSAFNARRYKKIGTSNLLDAVTFLLSYSLLFAFIIISRRRNRQF